jgi:hypothetical protein
MSDPPVFNASRSDRYFTREYVSLEWGRTSHPAFAALFVACESLCSREDLVRGACAVLYEHDETGVTCEYALSGSIAEPEMSSRWDSTCWDWPANRFPFVIVWITYLSPANGQDHRHRLEERLVSFASEHRLELAGISDGCTIHRIRFPHAV